MTKKTTKNKKTVACIMPLYNYAKYLDEALNSVFNQSVLPDEVIIVDDCSTDNPKPIINKYPSVIYIKHDKNRGLSASRNTGIRHAKSEYCFSFDSDDIMRPDCIKEHLKLADEKSIVTCALMAFGNENYTARPRKATIDILLKTNCIYSNSLFPKQAWIDVGGFDESPELRAGFEDREFWLRCLGAGYESKTSNYVALLWRRHPNTMSDTTANPNAQKLQDYIYNKNKHLANRP